MHCENKNHENLRYVDRNICGIVQYCEHMA